MDAGNPFDSETFICDIQPWLNTVPPERLRTAAIRAHLITDRATIATLRRTLANIGSADHNEALVESIVAEGPSAYQKLCSVVKTLGYVDRHEQMVQLLRRPGPQLDAGSSSCAAGNALRIVPTAATAAGAVAGAVAAAATTTAEVAVASVEAAPVAAEVAAAAVAPAAPVAAAAAAPAAAPVAAAPVASPPVAAAKGEQGDVPPPPQVQRAQDLLAARYRRARDRFIPGMMPEGTVPTVENVQINLLMLPKGSLSDVFVPSEDSSSDFRRPEHVFLEAGRTMQPVQLESVIGDAASDNRQAEPGSTVGTIAVASAGCGKTFAFTKVAPLKWAMGQLCQRKKLLIARELHHEDVKMAKSLSGLLGLEGIGIEDSHDRQVICEYVRAQPDALCLVLDGLDEINFSECSSFVQGVIQGEELPGVHLIVTSRPCPDVFSLSAMPHFQQHIELVGFQPDDVQMYVNKVLRSEKAAQLTAEIKRSDYLRGMMATPFIAKQVCTVYHVDDFIPQCIADLFEQMVVQIAERKCARKLGRWTAIPKAVRVLIVDIGEFAYSMLTKMQLIFSEENVQEYALSEEAICLGLLVTCEESLSKDAVRQYRFSHLTVQEHLAAIYQSQALLHDQRITKASIVQLVDNLGANSGHLTMFWTLLCARLNAGQAEWLLNALMKHGSSLQVDRYVLNDLSRPSTTLFPFNFILPLSEVLTPELMPKLAGELLRDPFSGPNACDYVISRIPKEGRASSDVAWLRVLLSEWQDGVEDANLGSLLQSLGNVSPGLRQYCKDKLHGQHMNWSGQCIKDMYSFNSPLIFSCFAEFAVHQKKADCPLPSVGVVLRSQELHINGTAHPADCRSIDAVLKHHRSTAIQSISVDHWTSSNAAQFPSSLALCSGIQELRVGRCSDDSVIKIVMNAIKTSSSSLTTLNIWGKLYVALPLPSLCGALPQWSHLTELDLSSTDFRAPENAGPSRLQSMPSCQQLETLRLRSCHLTFSTGVAMVTGLAENSSLRKLDLGDNPDLGDDAFVEICRVLHNRTEMTLVTLSMCGLTAVSLPSIIVGLLRWTQLEVLDISNNNFSMEATDTLRCEPYSITSEPRKLLAISLISCSLTSGTGIALATCLAGIKSVFFLDMKDNPELGDHGAAQILQACRECSHMRILCLARCGLTSSCLPALTAARQCWTHLQELDICFNDLSDISSSQVAGFTAANFGRSSLATCSVYLSEPLPVFNDLPYFKIVSPESYPGPRQETGLAREWA
ncbi:uncharacterized protein LOC135815241 [Sycon ciliatum]|uniref:uncharacterized protein LOC135815241 n=1 Tax=Sycon ciliatum TaxID=27933 RepID=UPI0031F65E1E